MILPTPEIRKKISFLQSDFYDSYLIFIGELKLIYYEKKEYNKN